MASNGLVVSAACPFPPKDLELMQATKQRSINIASHQALGEDVLRVSHYITNKNQAYPLRLVNVAFATKQEMPITSTATVRSAHPAPCK